MILPLADSHALAQRLRGAGLTFVIEPTPRFAGHPGEQ